MRTLTSVLIALAATALIAVVASAQNQADIDGVNRVLDQLAQLEDALDEPAQARLMSADRVWIAQGLGRRTDQALNTRIQQAGQEALKRAVPGLQLFTDFRDRVIRFYGSGTVAVASFYGYQAAIVPPDTPPAIAEPLQAAPPQAFTVVLEKRGSAWLIVHLHVSDL